MNFALTKTQLYVLAAAAGFGVLWLLNRKAGGPIVELGVGTVNGIYSGDYQTPKPGPVPDETNTPEHQRMLDLIDESNAALASYDAAHPEQI